MVPTKPRAPPRSALLLPESPSNDSMSQPSCQDQNDHFNESNCHYGSAYSQQWASSMGFLQKEMSRRGAWEGGVAEEFGLVKHRRDFHIHDAQLRGGRFPFHFYLKEDYGKLTLDEEIKLAQLYFKSGGSPEGELTIEDRHVQSLNAGLSLLTKVPHNSLLFLIFTHLGPATQLVVVKNYNGEIIYFKHHPAAQKRSTIIISIKRKLKDECRFNQTLLTKRMFIKLSKSMNFLYVRPKNTPDQYARICASLLEGGVSNQFSHGRQARTGAMAEEDSRIFSAFCEPAQAEATLGSLHERKKRLLEHYQFMKQEQENLIRADTISGGKYPRLLLLDALYINFAKSTHTGKQLFIKTISNMSRKYARVPGDEKDIEKDHYPEKMLNSRRCKNCEILDRKQMKKSKYKCIACSKRFKTDIPLCLSCIKEFHFEVLPLIWKEQVKNFKISYAQRLMHHNSISNRFPLICKQAQQLPAGNDQINFLICRLNRNMEEVHQLSEDIQQQSASNCLIGKEINQLLFHRIIICFNQIIERLGDGATDCVFGAASSTFPSDSNRSSKIGND